MTIVLLFIIDIGSVDLLCDDIILFIYISYFY